MFLNPMQAEIEKAVQAGKVNPRVASTLEKLPAGAYCLHKSWGFGRIAEINFLLNQAVIDFKTKKGHTMQLQYAAESLTPLAEDHILVRKVTDPGAIKAMAKQDPVGLVRLILASYGGKANQDQIAQALSGEIFNEAEFKRWWDSAKKALKKDGHIALPTKKSDPIVLRETAISQSDELLATFQAARQTKAQIAALDQILKSTEEFKGGEELKTVVATVEDAAQKSRRLNTAQALELILGRDELCTITGIAPGEGTISLSELLHDEERRLHEILNEVPAAKQRRVLAAFPTAFGEEKWVEKILVLMSKSGIRVASEIGRLLLEQGKKAELRRELDRWLGDHTISTEVLTWLCKEREGAFAEMVDARVLSATLSALERDQFNEVKRGGKLHDLLLEDRELVPDMLAGAEPEIVRDTIRKVMLSGVFEELNKRSILGRIVRVYPEMEAMLTGDMPSEKQEALIVSWESLEKRKNELDELVNKKIPENIKEISLARSYGDLRENFEFKAAKEMQRVLSRRRAEMERDLGLARGTDFANPDTQVVSIGTIVTIKEITDGRLDVYSIMGAWDSDPKAGVISYKAGIAQALLGHKVGEKLDVPTEHGDRVAEIVKIEAARKAAQ
ncbi:MAG: GreA/GreB family elongation factor [Verrucomicrobia bacterium]|nr:GreA/GreB family elongation factor [Verrucomicrobiota bacterium]